MHFVLTREQIRAAEAKVVERGVDELFLRFDASLAVADGIERRAGMAEVRTAVFCGAGGNGCDGILAAARLVRKHGNVTVYTVGDCAKKNKRALEYAAGAGVPVRPCAEYEGDAQIVIDAIFGIGLSRPIEGETAELIDRLNASDAFRLAIDIPSGLNADTGEIMGTAFRAHVTLSFSCYKMGMLVGEGRNVCGHIAVDDVGVSTASDIKVYENEDFKPFERKKTAHKGDCGRVFVIGGNGNMIGAPILAGAAAHAAHLNGAGLVTVCVPSVHRVALSSRVTMSTMMFMKDTSDGAMVFDAAELDEITGKASAICIGMGMGTNKRDEIRKILEYLVRKFDGALIIDADGINALAGDYGFIKNRKAKIVLTPHVGEFTRLTGKPATFENAKALAAELDCVVVLKSATTAITDGKEIRLNITGTPAMAKGGTGDVLAGCITALSCTYPLIDAATVACYRNGYGAERAVSSYAEMMLTPHEILRLADYSEV